MSSSEDPRPIPHRALCTPCWIMRMETNLGLREDDHPCQLCVDRQDQARRRLEEWYLSHKEKGQAPLSKDIADARQEARKKGSGASPAILKRTENFYKPSKVDWQRLAELCDTSFFRKKGVRAEKLITKGTLNSPKVIDLTRSEASSMVQATMNLEEGPLGKRLTTVKRKLPGCEVPGSSGKRQKGLGHVQTSKVSGTQFEEEAEEHSCTTITRN